MADLDSEGSVVVSRRIDALAVLLEVASWDRGESAVAVDVSWAEDGHSLSAERG